MLFPMIDLRRFDILFNYLFPEYAASKYFQIMEILVGSTQGRGQHGARGAIASPP